MLISTYNLYIKTLSPDNKMANKIKYFIRYVMEVERI